MSAFKPDTHETRPPIRFDLLDLETFLTVAELGSFTLAAKRLCISQPSVTSRIQRFEALMRVPLLIRTTRHVELSPHGARLRKEAEKILRGVRVLIRDFHSESLLKSSQVVVAATPGIAAVILPPLIRAYTNRHPHAQIKVLDRQYEEVLTSIDSGEADLAVTSIDDDETRYDFHRLTDEPMMLVLPADHPLAGITRVSLEHLAPYPLMTLERYTSARDKILEEAVKRDLRLLPVFTVANQTTLLGMVDAGNGLAFLPESMAQINAKHQRTTLPITDLSLHRVYGVLQSRQTSMSNAAVMFSTFLRESYTQIVVKA